MREEGGEEGEGERDSFRNKKSSFVGAWRAGLNNQNRRHREVWLQKAHELGVTAVPVFLDI